MKAPGVLTAEMGDHLEKDLKLKGYIVLYDHGPAKENMGKIAARYGPKPKKELRTGLSQLDIAIIDRKSENVTALIEIEETSDKPKTLLGDVFATLLGERFTFNIEKSKLKVGPWTTLIVLGKGTLKDKARIEFLSTRVDKIIAGQKKEDMSVGKVIIDYYFSDKDLERKLREQIDLACKRAK
jgi:hypothetical protein